MRAAGRHTVPPLILKRVRRPPPDPDSTSQTRQPPSTMRPASLCRPGNRRPPCDQPHLAAPAIAVHHATSPPCRPGNCRPPCDQPHLAAPAIAACHADQPTLQTRQPPSARHAALLHTGPTAAARRRRSSREADGCFTAPPPLHSQKGQRGQPKGPAVGRGGVAEGRGRGGKGLRKGGVQSEGPQPYPAWACGESGGVFSRALYHLQA